MIAELDRQRRGYEITQSDVVTLEQSVDMVLDNSPSKDDVKALVIRIKTCEDLIRNFRKTGEVVKKFAEIQCRMFMRIVEEGYANCLTKAEQNVAKWAANLPQKRREEICELCGREGITVTTYYNRAIKDEKFKEKLSLVKEAAPYLLEEYREYGSVSATERHLLSIARIRYSETNSGIARVPLPEIRSKLKRLGAVSNGNGVYFNPKTDEGRKAAKDLAASHLTSLVRKAEGVSETLSMLGLDVGDLEIGNSTAIAEYCDVKHIAIPMLNAYRSNAYGKGGFL